MTKYFSSILAITLFSSVILSPAVSNGKQSNSDESRRLAEIAENLFSMLDRQSALFYRPGLEENLLQLIASAIDSRAEIMTAEEAGCRREMDAGIFYGIGFKTEIENNRPYVRHLIPNSPAAAAGIPIGAIILSINGKDTFDMSHQTVERSLHGGKDQIITLKYKVPQSTEPTPPSAEMPSPDDSGLEDENNLIVRLKCTISALPKTGTTEDWPLQLAYMQVNGIYTGSGAYITDQMRAWSTREIAGIIMDLRGADGTDIESAAVIAGLFAEPGAPLFLMRDGKGNVMAEFKADDSKKIDLPVMALVDKHISGAAQILVAAMRNCRGAMLIGEPCPADLALRDFIPMENGDFLYIATQKAELTPSVPETQIIPDVVISPDDQALLKTAPEPGKPDIFTEMTEQQRQEQALTRRIGTDAALRRAADILLGLKALSIGKRPN